MFSVVYIIAEEIYAMAIIMQDKVYNNTLSACVTKSISLPILCPSRANRIAFHSANTQHLPEMAVIL